MELSGEHNTLALVSLSTADAANKAAKQALKQNAQREKQELANSKIATTTSAKPSSISEHVTLPAAEATSSSNNVVGTVVF